MAGGNVNQIELVENQPLEKCLLLLAYVADRNSMMDMMHKEQMAKISQ